MTPTGENFSASRCVAAARSWLLQNVPLKRRRFLTRHGRLRARYMVLPAMPMLALMLSAAHSLPLSSVMTAHAAMPAPSSYAAADVEPEAAMAVRQQRLQRYAALPPEPAPAAPEPREETVVVGKGDTLAGVLQKTGMDGASAYNAVQAVAELFDPRAIRPGQKISVRFDPNEDGSDYGFAQLTMDVDALKTLRLDQNDGTFHAQMDEKEVVRRQYAKEGNIELSLYGSALKANVPATLVAGLIRVFSWDIDFQRDIRQGDSFKVMYDQIETADGTPVQGGDILYARMTVNGRDIALYRYEGPDGTVDYYTPDGASIRKALLSTPVDGARLSSGFGQRKHPVLGYTKMHKGVDFAAPVGTPIYAAGDGTIEQIGRWSSYGNYVRIRHNSSTKTAYAHMKGFAKGLGNGSRVKQGQVIGYIGTTGRSTGPHLHYEVMVNGTQVNPRGVKMQQGETLKGKQLAAFQSYIARIDRQYAALSGSMKMASAETQPRAGNIR